MANKAESPDAVTRVIQVKTSDPTRQARPDSSTSSDSSLELTVSEGIEEPQDQIDLTQVQQHRRSSIKDLGRAAVQLEALVSDLGGDPAPILVPDTTRTETDVSAYEQTIRYKQNMNYEDPDADDKSDTEKLMEDLQADVHRLRMVAWSLGRNREDVDQQSSDTAEV